MAIGGVSTMRVMTIAGAMILALSAGSGMAADESEAEAEIDLYAPETVRCERVQVTGSRVRRSRVCMTNEQWADYRAGTTRDARNMLDRSTIDSTNHNRQCGRPEC